MALCFYNAFICLWWRVELPTRCHPERSVTQSKDLPPPEATPLPNRRAVVKAEVAAADRKVLRLRSLTRCAQDDSDLKIPHSHTLFGALTGQAMPGRGANAKGPYPGLGCNSSMLRHFPMPTNAKSRATWLSTRSLAGASPAVGAISVHKKARVAQQQRHGVESAASAGANPAASTISLCHIA